MEAKLYAFTTLDTSVAIPMINLYEAFAQNYANDSIAPECLFKAAEISSSLKQGKNEQLVFLQTFMKNIQNMVKHTIACFCLLLFMKHK